MDNSRQPNYSPYPGDQIEANLEDGELVMNRNAVKFYGKDNLEAMNDAHPRYPQGMQKGGSPVDTALAKARAQYASPDMKSNNMFSRSFTTHNQGNQYPITYNYPKSGGINIQSHRPRSQSDIFAQMQNVENRYRHVRPTVNGVDQYNLEMEPLKDAYIKKGLKYNNKPVQPFLKQKDSSGLDAKNAAIMDAKIVSEGKKRAQIDEALAMGPSIEQLDVRRGPSQISYDSIQPVEAPHMPAGLELDRTGQQIWDDVAKKSDALPSWDELNSAGTTEVPKEDVDSNQWKQAQHWAQKLNESDYMFAPQDVKDAIGKRDSLMDMVRANQQRDELAMDIEEEIHAPNRARLAKMEADRQAQREAEMMTPPEMPEDKQRQFANYSLPGHEQDVPLNTIKEAMDGYDDGQRMGAYSQWVIGSGGTPSDILNYRHLAKKQGATDDMLSHIDDGYKFAMDERYGKPKELELRQQPNQYADVMQPVDVPKVGPDIAQRVMGSGTMGGLKGAMHRFAIGVHKGATGDKVYAQEGGLIGANGRQNYLLGGAAALYGLGKAGQWAKSGKPQEMLKSGQEMYGQAKDFLSSPMADPELVKQMAKDDPAMWAGAKVGDTGKAIYEGGKTVAGGIGAAGKYLWEGRDDKTHPGGGIKGAHEWGKKGGYEKIKQGTAKGLGFIGSMLKEAANPGYLDMAMSGQLNKTKGDIGITVDSGDKEAGDAVSEVDIAGLEVDDVKLNQSKVPPKALSGSGIAVPGVHNKKATADDVIAGRAKEEGEVIPLDARDSSMIVDDPNAPKYSPDDVILSGDEGYGTMTREDLENTPIIGGIFKHGEDPYGETPEIQYDDAGNVIARPERTLDMGNVNLRTESQDIDPLGHGMQDNTNVDQQYAKFRNPDGTLNFGDGSNLLDQFKSDKTGTSVDPNFIGPFQNPDDEWDPNQQVPAPVKKNVPGQVLDLNPMEEKNPLFKSKGGIVRAMRKFVSGKGKKWDGRNRRRSSPRHLIVGGKRNPLHNRRQSDRIPIKLQKGGSVAVTVANKARRIYG